MSSARRVSRTLSPDVPLPAVPRARLRAALAAQVILWLAARLPARIVSADAPVTGNSTDDLPVLTIHQPNMFYRRVGTRGLIGFGESYQAGEWDSDDLAGLLTLIARRWDALIPQRVRQLRQYVGPRRPRHTENTIAGARRNISHHYDLPDAMFRLFLDETMTYSSALFEVDHDGCPVADSTLLVGAQTRKVDRLLDATGVRAGSNVLEIGTGWGFLALRAAARGANVRTVTISAEQQRVATERIAAAGLTQLVDVELCDYREVELPGDLGPGYDAIISVEMIEAVGDHYWPAYFHTLDRLLAPNGRVGLQAITMREDRTKVARRTHSWLNEYIFPGGLIPSVADIEEMLGRYTSLRVSSRFTFGAHYAQTLAVWQECFADRHTELRHLGFSDTFLRTWELYLASCEAGFRSGYLDVCQFVLTRDETADKCATVGR
jgi:cyclopropane-fatty-acyl-phospholipid synthase